MHPGLHRGDEHITWRLAQQGQQLELQERLRERRRPLERQLVQHRQQERRLVQRQELVQQQAQARLEQRLLLFCRKRTKQQRR